MGVISKDDTKEPAMKTTALADQLATQYGIDRAAAQTAVDTYTGQLQDNDLYDTETGALTDDGVACIVEQFAADYQLPGPVGERHDNLLAGIREAEGEISAAQRQADERTDRRDWLIRRAVAEGVRVADIADAAGIKPARVYQIRDGRR